MSMSRQEEMLRMRGTEPGWGRVIFGLLVSIFVVLAAAYCVAIMLANLLPGFVTFPLSLILIVIGEFPFYVRFKRRFPGDTLQHRIPKHGIAIMASAYVVVLAAAGIAIVPLAFA